MVQVVGSVRRECPTVGDIEICAMPKDPDSLNKLFPKDFRGLVMGGDRMKRFKYPDRKLQLELYIPEPHDWGRIVAIRTGSRDFSQMKLAVTWNRLGWCGTKEGLRRKKECIKLKSYWKLAPEFANNPTLPPEFASEEIFFEFLGIPWVEPRDRDWHFQNQQA